KGDDLRDRIDHQIGARRLHDLPVEPRDQVQALRIGNLVRSDDPWAERASAGKVLPRCNGEFLIIAHAAVHEAGVARNVLERALDRDAPSGAAYDDCKLALEIEALRNDWPYQLALVADQGV